MNKIIPEELKEQPEKWSCENVAYWFVKVLLMPQYLESIKLNQVDGSKLVQLVKNKRLHEIQIEEKKELKIISQKMKKMLFKSKKKKEKKMDQIPAEDISYLYCCEVAQINSIAPDVISNWNRDNLNDWLNLNDLAVLIDLFQVENIGGEILFEINEEYLNHLGVNRADIVIRFLNSLHDLNSHCYHLNHNNILQDKCFFERRRN